ncbi:hypothetical protein [Nocardia brasiliensis]
MAGALGSAAACRVVAALHNSTVAQKPNLVRVDHCGQPMRDNDCLALSQLVHTTDDDFLAVRIGHTGHLVEQHDRRIIKQRPRDRNPLPLNAQQRRRRLLPHIVTADGDPACGYVGVMRNEAQQRGLTRVARINDRGGRARRHARSA